MRSSLILLVLICGWAGHAEEDGEHNAEQALTARLAEWIRRSADQAETGDLKGAMDLLKEAREQAALQDRPEVKQIDARIKRLREAQLEEEAKRPSAVLQQPSPELLRNKVDSSEPREELLLTLAECEEIAIQNNLNLRISRLNDLASDLDLQVAWSRYLPEFRLEFDHGGGRGGESHSNTLALGGGITQRTPWGSTLSADLTESEAHPGVRGARKSTNMDLRLTQPLWKDAGLDVGLFEIRSAKLNRLISRGNLELDVQNLLFDVRSTYSDCIRQIQTLEVNERAVRSADRFLGLTIHREKAGQVTKLDVFNAEVQKGNREETLLRNRTAMENALDQLKQIMDVDLEENLQVVPRPLDFGDEQPGKDGDKTVETDAPSGSVLLVSRKDGQPIGEPKVVFRASRYDPKVILEDAISHRIELLNSRRQFALRKLQTLLNKDGLGHQVDLTAAYNRSGLGSNWAQSHGLENHDYSVGLRLSMPWGKVSDRAAYERALINLQTSEIALKQTRTSVHAQVRDILRRLQEAEKSILIQAQTVEQAKRSVEAAQISFERGLKDSFDVISAEDNLLSAKTGFINRMIEYEVRKNQLELVVGKPSGRIDLKASQPGGLIEGQLPPSLDGKRAPAPAPPAAPSLEDDPLNNFKD